MPTILTEERNIINDYSIDEHLDNLIFATIENPDDSVIKQVSSMNLSSSIISFNGSELLVISKYELFPKLKKAISPTSKALYLCWHEINANPVCAFLLQYLSPNSKTSKHFHKHQTEIFYVLEGEYYMNGSEEKRLIEPGTKYIVKPYTVHQSQTNSSPSFTAIEMVNIKCLDHHYVDSEKNSA